MPGRALSILVGWWLRSELPDLIACSGILLVFAAGLYLLNRERLSLSRAHVTTIDRSPAE